ncbi:microtubule integrity protein mal3 [Cryptotrichosporon argae]
MSVYTGESRGELLTWLNELLAPSEIKKVEECGKGAIYCQIIDSIFGDVALQRVKFNAKQEYEYLENFKVLQKAFNQHQIDKPIPVDKLIKCKMQDNLEFLQWMKKYWDANSRGDGYDASSRSGGAVSAPPARAAAPSRPAASRAPFRAAGPSTTARAPAPAVSNAKIQALTHQVEQLEQSSVALEKERDFYFDKLRNIELIVKERLEAEPESADHAVFAQIQEILYQTEEGFEAPDAEGALDDEHALAEAVDEIELGAHGRVGEYEEETF